MQVLESIEKAGYVADDGQVESLASLVAQGTRAGSTYLAVLIAHCRNELRKGPKRKKEQREAINKVHERFMPAVMRGVGPADLPNPERHRRAVFARTAASDLRFYVARGGDVRKLDPARASKTSLRKSQRVPAGTRAERAYIASTDAAVRAARQIAKGNPKAAAKHVRLTLVTMQKLLAELQKAKPAQVQVKRKAKAKRKPVKTAKRANGHARRVTPSYRRAPVEHHAAA